MYPKVAHIMWYVLRNGRWAVLHSFTILLIIFSACTKPSGNGQGFSGKQDNTVIVQPDKVQIRKTGEHRLTASAPAGTIRAPQDRPMGQLTIWSVSKEELERIGQSKSATISISGKLLAKATPNPDGSFSVDLPAITDGYLLIAMNDGETGLLAIPAPGDATTAIAAPIQNGQPGTIESVFKDQPLAAVSTDEGTTPEVPAPKIVSISPSGGALGGMTPVTIAGENLTGTNAVSLGGSVCSGLVVTPTQVTCSTSAHAAGMVDAAVSRNDGRTAKLTNAFTYANAPSIQSMSPTAGPLAGSTGTLIGSGFVSGASVTIGGTTAVGVAGGGGTQLSFAIPPHAAGDVDVRVTNPDGQQSTNLVNAFTYQAAPTVSNISPTSGSTVGGYLVSITGTNFLPGASVDLGGVACSNPTVLSPMQINCTTPSHAPGTLNVHVQNSDSQTSVSAVQFTFAAPPATCDDLAGSSLWTQFNSSQVVGDDGTSLKPYRLCTKDQVLDLRRASGNVHIWLLKDVDMTATTYIPSNNTLEVNGVFDGRGHKIRNLTFSELNLVSALFYRVRGTVRNLTLENINMNISFGTGGYAGSIAAILQGVIESCTVSGNIHVLANYTSYVGGFAGMSANTAVIRNSASSVSPWLNTGYVGCLQSPTPGSQAIIENSVCY